MVNKEALAKLDFDKLEEIVIEVFSVLNKNKVSPEEGFYIAQEILATSIERFAKTNNISIEDVRHKLIEVMTNSVAAPAAKKNKAVYVIGQDRGWVGNQNTLTEDN
jgi:hypothetical protein